MYLTPTGYWRPDKGEIITLAEIPHFIKFHGEKDGKSFRGFRIPNPRQDGLDADKDFIVDGLLSAQDIHYEYVFILPPADVLYWAENNITMLEIPQRYFKPSSHEYKNSYKA